MLIGARRRRSPVMAGGGATHAVAVRLLPALVGLLAVVAAFASVGTASAAPAYPPTTPCALSWNGTGTTTLLGSGLGAGQSVQVVLHPQTRSLGSFVANSDGAFQARVAVPAGTRRHQVWLTATSRSASCSTPGRAPAAAPAPGGGTATGLPGPGSSPTPGSSIPSGTATSSGAAVPSTAVSPQPTGAASTPHLGEPVSSTRVGLPLSWIVGIALLLILGGGLAVLFLTRRAG